MINHTLGYLSLIYYELCHLYVQNYSSPSVSDIVISQSLFPCSLMLISIADSEIDGQAFHTYLDSLVEELKSKQSLHSPGPSRCLAFPGTEADA